MKVKLSNIIDAMEFTDKYTEYYLDQETGELVYINEMMMMRSEIDDLYDQLDKHGFYRLPSSFDIGDYDIMEDFVYQQTGSKKERLAKAISGKGAFRRFKDTVSYLGLDEDWYKWQEDVYKRKAVRWCEENDIKYEE